MDTGCFHILAIINNAVMNIGGMYLFKLVFSFFFGCIPGSRIAESYGSSTSHLMSFKFPSYFFSPLHPIQAILQI